MISESLQQRKTRTRRSMLFVPGANAAMVSNSFIYPADALMFDLEDSVASVSYTHLTLPTICSV